jgi:hypothetical protein
LDQVPRGGPGARSPRRPATGRPYGACPHPVSREARRPAMRLIVDRPGQGANQPPRPFSALRLAHGWAGWFCLQTGAEDGMAPYRTEEGARRTPPARDYRNAKISEKSF